MLNVPSSCSMIRSVYLEEVIRTELTYMHAEMASLDFGNHVVGFTLSQMTLSGRFMVRRFKSKSFYSRMSEIEFSASSLSYATFDALPFISIVDVGALGSSAECLEIADDSTEPISGLGLNEALIRNEMNYTPGICTLKTRQNTCRWPTASVQRLNSWTCRNCFRIRQGLISMIRLTSVPRLLAWDS